ncbi:MAG: UDP-N-acetylglucosamine--N-acetylmuramyl-(pentapeptide) pyrophosphoryl-undecaprenol N-acetylglucosamine transferase [Patescibacteria group bacterium]
MALEKIKKIIFSGGGTGGSVTPLLTVAEELLKEGVPLDLVFVGTTFGPEKELLASFSSSSPIKFIPLPSGKWRRYFSIYNLTDIFKIIVAFLKSFAILRQEKPDLIVSAGSFVSVPLVFAASLKKIPVLIHQQDIRPGLANKLMAPWARVITVTFEKSLIDYGPKAVLIGNPVKDLSNYQSDKATTKERYSLNDSLPVVLALGGGTGSRALNELISEALLELTGFCQLVHITGQGKLAGAKPIANYQPFEFLVNKETLALMAASDLVVSRAGLGVLTELAALNKPAILIPLPDSHQEDNTDLFARAKAALVFKQSELTPQKLTEAIKQVLDDEELKTGLSQNIGKIIKKQAAANFAGIIWEILNNH